MLTKVVCIFIGMIGMLVGAVTVMVIACCKQGRDLAIRAEEWSNRE